MPKSPAMNAMAMTPPRSAPGQTTKAGRPGPFNPTTRYPVKLADRLREGHDKDSQIVTRIDVDPEIKFTGNSVEATVELDPIDPENTAFLVVSSKADNSKQQYRGTMNSDSNLYTLTFDPAVGAFILDRIDATIAFSVKRPASSGSDASASDSDGYGTPDPNDPYDWRHHLNQRDSSPEDAGSMRSGPESFAGSPAPMHSGDFRKASSPPESLHSEAMGRTGSRTAASISAQGGDDDDNDNLVFDFDTDDGDAGSGPPNRGRPPSKLGRGRAGPILSLASIAHSRSTSRQPLSTARRAGRASDFDDNDVLAVELEPSPPPRSQNSISEHDVDVSDIDIDGPKSPSLASHEEEPSTPLDDIENEPEPEHEPEHEIQPDFEVDLEDEMQDVSHSQSQSHSHSWSHSRTQDGQQEEAPAGEDDDAFEHAMIEVFGSPSSEEVSEEE